MGGADLVEGGVLSGVRKPSVAILASIKGRICQSQDGPGCPFPFLLL
jgi:hypothetical protein